MDALKTFGIALCTAVIAAAMISSLAPKGSTSKSVKTAVGLFLLLTLLSPLKKVFDNGIKIDMEDIFSSSGESKSDGADALANETLRAFLEKSGYKNVYVRCETELTEKGSINISKITVVSNALAATQKEDITALFLENFNVAPEFE
ncbi:MAG: stage III sporulation protein AF [Oscillospiraceae bacterium]